MTDDGEAPDAGSDRDEERASPTDEDGPAAEADESTPAVGGEDGGRAAERDSQRPNRDVADPGHGAEPEPTDAGLTDDESAADDADRTRESSPTRPDEAEPEDVDEVAGPGAGGRVDGRDAGEPGDAGGELDSSTTPFDSGDERGDPGDAESERESDVTGRAGTEGAARSDESTGTDEPGAGPPGEPTGHGGPADEAPDSHESSEGEDVATAGEPVAPGDRGEVSDERASGGASDGVRDDEEAPGVTGELEAAVGTGEADGPDVPAQPDVTAEPDVPEDVRSYDRFKKVDRASYDRVNEFLRDRTYITAREWAIARLCADFRTATGVEMTKIGENLPHLVPFMTDTYSPQAVNQARSAFEGKVRKSGATFLYGAMSGFFTADELDDIMYEITEVAKFLLEVEGVELTVDEELDAEDRISAVMREVRQASEELRYEDVECPECGTHFHPPGSEEDVDGPDPGTDIE